MHNRKPGEGRYARTEREQRWLLTGVPAGATGAAEVIDRYITGTQLRLRRMVTSDKSLILKLAQKVRANSHSPEVVKITNVYLTHAEHDVLATLPAAEIRKVRLSATIDGRRVSVDKFGGPLAGLILAEVELGFAEERLPLLPDAVRDVTDDDRYSGGMLAAASAGQIQALLNPGGTGLRQPSPPS